MIRVIMCKSDIRFFFILIYLIRCYNIILFDYLLGATPFLYDII